MSSPGPRRRNILGAALLAMAPVVAILFRFPPDRYSFYPPCPVSLYLHMQCPGCGTTRALAALLHGNVAEALHLNLLTTLLLPIAFLYVLRHQWLQRGASSASLFPHPSQYAIYALLAVTLAFTVARNLA